MLYEADGYDISIAWKGNQPKVKLARALDCCLFFPEFRSISTPDVGRFGNEIQNSTATRFCDAPRAFLNDLAKQSL